MEKFSCLILFIIALISCESDKSFETAYQKFLIETSIIDLSGEVAGEERIFSLNSANFNGEEIVVFDQVAEEFLKLDKHGNVLQTFGSKGRGPFEFEMFTNTYLSESGDFFVYDLSTSKIINYSNSGSFSEFYIQEKLIDMVVNKNGEILIYHLTEDDDYVLSLYNSEGQVIKHAFYPKDKKLKSFLYRFKDGGLSYSSEEGLYYFLYPNEDVIYILDDSLDVSNKIRLEDKALFKNEFIQMPESFSPYQMSESHWEYWSSFYHPAKISLVGSNYILIKHYEIEDQNNWQVYYNLYTKSGKIVFEGLVFSDSLKVVESDMDYLNLADISSSVIKQFSVK